MSARTLTIEKAPLIVPNPTPDTETSMCNTFYIQGKTHTKVTTSVKITIELDINDVHLKL